ncbi:MAG: hypothetical protein HUU56_17305 [Bdellovibrionaceae bacterium]|nr:hypothetical protein [Pseudobdellovibrionaceae bacterium]
MVYFSSACTLHYSILDLASQEQNDRNSPGSSLPSFADSMISVSPEVTSVPLGAEVVVKYCLYNQSGNAVDDATINLSFSLEAGGSSGVFSTVNYNSNEKCYEATLTATVVGSPVNINVSVDGVKIASKNNLQLTVVVPNFNFSGNSLVTAPIVNRIFDETSGGWNLTGVCEFLLNDVEVYGPSIVSGGIIGKVFSTPCSSDGVFSVRLNVDGITSPFILQNDPLIMIRQKNHSPVVTRIYHVSSTYSRVMISSVADLQGVVAGGAASFKNYFLLNDIDLSVVSSTNNFTPIGNSSTYWVGNFYGEKHKITNLHINGGSDNFVGFFGQARSGRIFDLSFSNATVISSGIKVGVLAGQSQDLFVNRVSVEGSVSGVGWVGLITGYCWDCTVESSWVTGVSQGDQSVGGLLGYAWGGDIFNSWSDVTVTSTAEVAGGLVAILSDASTDGIIENSFSLGSVTGAEGVGGVVGTVSDSIPFRSVQLRNSFSLGNVTTNPAPVSYISGFIVGSAGVWDGSNYNPTSSILMSGLYHSDGSTCSNCNPSNVHGDAENLSNILIFTQNVWNYSWVWKIHSSGLRPDLIVNPKP